LCTDSWTRIADDETIFGGTNEQRMSDVVAGGPGLVAVGRDGSGGDEDAAVWTSTDGETWTRIPHNETTFGGTGNQAMFEVVAGGPGLVAVGFDGPVGDQAGHASHTTKPPSAAPATNA